MAQVINTNLENLTEYPNSFKRQGLFPLDSTSLHITKDSLNNYIESKTAYIGQIITLVDSEDSNRSTTFRIDQAADGSSKLTKFYTEDDIKAMEGFGIVTYSDKDQVDFTKLYNGQIITITDIDNLTASAYIVIKPDILDPSSGLLVNIASEELPTAAISDETIDMIINELYEPDKNNSSKHSITEKTLDEIISDTYDRTQNTSSNNSVSEDIIDDIID